MRLLKLHSLTAVLTICGLLLADLAAGAQTVGTTPLQPLPPVANNDPRFGVVQAVYAPVFAVNAGVRWERLIFSWEAIQPSDHSQFERSLPTEDQIEGELARGIELVGLTLYTPGWAARDPQDGRRSVPPTLSSRSIIRRTTGQPTSGDWSESTAAASKPG